VSILLVPSMGPSGDFYTKDLDLAAVIGRRQRKERGSGDDAAETGTLADMLALCCASRMVLSRVEQRTSDTTSPQQLKGVG
jgi:hypothetical protein